MPSSYKANKALIPLDFQLVTLKQFPNCNQDWGRRLTEISQTGPFKMLENPTFWVKGLATTSMTRNTLLLLF